MNYEQNAKATCFWLEYFMEVVILNWFWRVRRIFFSSFEIRKIILKGPCIKLWKPQRTMHYWGKCINRLEWLQYRPCGIQLAVEGSGKTKQLAGEGCAYWNHLSSSSRVTGVCQMILNNEVKWSHMCFRILLFVDW